MTRIALFPNIILLSLSVLIVACYACDNDTTLKGIFAFGGDIIDNGNNNNALLTFAVKSNFLPYGVDFPDGPTGRFSNGKTVVDCIADHLNLPSPGSFSDYRAKKIPIGQGINFGSAGSGIQGVTGALMVWIWSLNRQINKFKNQLVPDLEKHTHCKAKVVLRNYLFIIGSGDNDYASYYILKQQIIWDPKTFASMLVKNYYKRIKKLYNVGAKMFLLLSVLPVGCEPGIVKNKSEQCIVELNLAIDLFYNELTTMVANIKEKNEMPGTEFTVVNSGKIVLDMIENPAPLGFTNVDCSCCDLSIGDNCKKAARVCLNRNEYVYFDGLHLTEAANSALASKAFSSNSSSEVYPVNLQSITQV